MKNLLILISVLFLPVVILSQKNNERDSIIQLLKKDPKTYKDFEQKFKIDEEIAIIAISENRSNVDYIPSKLKHDKEFAFLLVQKLSDFHNLSDIVQSIDRKLLKNKNFALRVINDDYVNYRIFDKKIKNNYEVVRAYINNGGDLEYVDEKFYTHKDLVLKSIANFYSWELFEPKWPVYISEQLVNDVEFTKKVICLNGIFLALVNDSIKSNKNIVYYAALSRIEALEFASENLRDDKEFILKLIEHDGYAFEFASPRLKKDKEVAIAALKRSKYAYLYFDPILFTDREFISEAIKISDYIIDYKYDYFKHDTSLLIEAVKNDCNLNEELVYGLSETKEMAKLMAKYSPRSYKDFCKESKLNKEIIRTAFEGTQLTFEDLPLEIQSDSIFIEELNAILTDKELLLENIKRFGFRHIKCPKLFLNDSTVALLSFQKGFRFLEQFTDEIRCNENVVLSAIANNIAEYKFICDSLKIDRNFTMKLFAVNPNIISLLPEEYRTNKDYMIKAISYNKRNIRAAYYTLFVDNDLFNTYLIQK